MDLNEMKASWQLLDKRLRQQEIVNKRIIQEMIARRTRSAHSRLIVSHLSGFVIVAAVLILILALRNPIGIRPEAIWIALGTLLPLLVYMMASARFLRRFDLEKSTLCQLRSWVLQLRKRQRMELRVGILYGTAVFCAGLLLNRHYHSAYQLLIDAVVVVFAAGITYFSYHHIEKKSADEIARGLQELEELERCETDAPLAESETGKQP